MSAAAVEAELTTTDTAPRSRVQEALGLRRTQIGLGLVIAIILIAVFGPLVAPHSPTEIVSRPYTDSSSAFPLGTDYLGRDVLTRVLYGGLSVVWMGLMAATIGVGLGMLLGTIAGYVGGWVDDAIMRTLDVVLAFPGVILALLFVSMLGPKRLLIVVMVALVWIPGVARVARGMAADLSSREFIVAAEIAGAPRWQVVVRELLPNMAMVGMVEFGLRLTWSIASIAALSFLGLGIQPPAADWGLMMNENRNGLSIQPWAVMAPVVLIAILTVGTNLVAEGAARTVARINA